MRATTFGVYGQELFSVYLDGPAETRSAAGGNMVISEGFSVYLNNMRTSSVRCDSDFRTFAAEPHRPQTSIPLIRPLSARIKLATMVAKPANSKMATIGRLTNTHMS